MRLFVGIELSGELKQTLLEFQSKLKELGVRGLWKSVENFHITLEFLGEIDPNAVPLLKEVLSKGTKNIKPFNLYLGGVGAFPSFRRPHTLWTAVGGDLKELQRLRDDVHLELSKNGFELEERKFKPHITLASRPVLDDIDLSAIQSIKLGEFLVEDVILFESRAVRGKRVYTDLHRQNLLGG